MFTPPSIAVIGAGPAGLAVSVGLMHRGVSVVCLESSGRAGGMLGTVRRDGFLAETGPHTLRLAGPLPAALFYAGLESRVMEANPAANRRFVTCGGRPVATPSSPFGMMASPLLSFSGKLRMLREPFIGKSPADTEETVAEFARRRIGGEALTRLLDAVVGGIYAGKPDELSVRHAFPRLHELEQKHGSLVRGAIAGARERRARGKPRVVSFPEGMTELPGSLARSLGDSLRTNATVTAVEKTSGGWRVSWREAGDVSREITVKAVVVATPSHAWSRLPLPGEFSALAARGAQVPHPPVAVVTLGYARERVAHPLDGFGVLTPGIENRKALGVLFPSSLFPNRAPAGAVTLAAFVGGARQPKLARLTETELECLVREECESLLGARGAPEFVNVTKWARAIPQYAPGHGGLLAMLGEAERAFPGLYFLGNYRGGPAVGSVLDNAEALAQIISGLGPRNSERGGNF